MGQVAAQPARPDAGFAAAGVRIPCDSLLPLRSTGRPACHQCTVCAAQARKRQVQFTPPKRAQVQALFDTPANQSTADVDSTQHGSVSATPTDQQQPKKNGNGGVAGSVFGTAHMMANVVAVGVKTLQSSSFRRHRTRRRRPVEEDTLPSNVLFRWLFRACLALQAFVWLRVHSYSPILQSGRDSQANAHCPVSLHRQHLCPS